MRGVLAEWERKRDDKTIFRKMRPDSHMQSEWERNADRAIDDVSGIHGVIEVMFHFFIRDRCGHAPQ